MSALRGRRCRQRVQNAADAVAAAADCDRQMPRVTVATLLLAVFTFKQEARGGGKRREGKKRDSGTEERREKMEEVVNVAKYSVPGNSRRENTVLVSAGRP